MNLIAISGHMRIFFKLIIMAIIELWLKAIGVQILNIRKHQHFKGITLKKILKLIKIYFGGIHSRGSEKQYLQKSRLA